MDYDYMDRHNRCVRQVKTCLVIWVNVFVLRKESYSGDILCTALNKYKIVHN